jgi:hypothetical protein
MAAFPTDGAGTVRLLEGGLVGNRQYPTDSSRRCSYSVKQTPKQSGCKA